jgi:hypothetical protein
MRTKGPRAGTAKGRKGDNAGPLDQQKERRRAGSRGSPSGPKGSSPDKHGGSGAGRQQGGSGSGRER